MKIIEAINKSDELKPNGYTQSDKIRWLSACDSMIKRNIIDTHEGGEDEEFGGYNDETDLTTELLVPEPYDEMYLTWLESKIDYTNGEYGKYNNSITRFNDTYKQYESDYNRTHMPKGTRVKYF